MVCEFCRVATAVVYCKSDAARLCLNCDSCVHAANPLSLRHLRSLICDKCVSQAAIVHCIDEKLSFCQVCEGGGCFAADHRRVKLSFYRGCPSKDEFWKIWPMVLDCSTVPDQMELAMGVGGGNDAAATVPAGGVVATRLNDIASSVKFEPLAADASTPPFPPPPQLPSLFDRDQRLTRPFNRDHVPFPSQGTTAQKGCGGESVEDVGIQESEDLCDSSVDIDSTGLSSLRFESGYYDLFGSLQNQPKYQCDDAATGGLLMNKNLSVTESNSTPPIESALEASSSVQQECMGTTIPTASEVAGSKSNGLMQAATSAAATNRMLMNPKFGLGFGSPQVPSSISLTFTNITGETSVAEYQYCGLSPLLLTGDSPWDSNFEPSCPQARDKAKMRYDEKKKTRTFGK